MDIDPESFRKVLKDKRAVLIHAERLMKRRTFDYPDSRLEKIGGWIRVRDEGDKITLVYKRLVDRTIKGTKEISVVVDDFDKTCSLLTAVGFENKSYQETKRERWELDGVEVTIDTWPWIPPIVELEAANEKKLKEAATELGLDWDKALHGSVENAYETYYRVTDQEVDGVKEITFGPVPHWLETRRKRF